MDGEQSTPQTTLPYGTGRQRDRQVGKQTRDIYVGRRTVQTKREDKNKTGREEKTGEVVLERKCEESERNGGHGGRKTGRWWERIRGSVGGKAKQVYVEKRRKQEEEWGAENGDMETKERAA